MCPTKTSPCAHSKRPCAYRQHVHMYTTCGRVAGTHGDVFECTHGGVLDGHTEGREGLGHCQSCLPKMAHVELSLAPEVHQSYRWILPIQSLSIGREQHFTHSSDHQSFALPDKTVQLRWFGLSYAPKPKYNARFCTSVSQLYQGLS